MKKIFALISVFLITFTLCMKVFAEDENLNTVKLSTALAEVNTGTVIASENLNAHMQPGSLCKLMTVLLTAEEIQDGRLGTDTVLTASANANAQNGAVIWLMQGEEITVDELLKAVIIGNANDAAIVLAEHIGKDEKGFVDMMNARAFELGMRDTVYKSCTGNSNIEGQYSTAGDTVKLACELLKHDFLKGYFVTWMDNVRNGQTELVNENKLVRTYEGITGLKAGRTENEGFSLVLSAEKNGKSFVSVVMGCQDKDERFAVAKELLKTGFSSYKLTIPSFSDEFIKPLAVHGGKQSAITIKAESLDELVVPQGCSELSTVVLIPDYIDAPVTKGQPIGRIGFYNGDSLLYETNLVANESVDKADFSSSIKKLLSIMYK